MGAHEIPFVIGVTGHRDVRPQDISRLEHAFEDIILQLRQRIRAPLIVVSALAEGADRIAARVALKLGLQLIAPLPLPIKEYRRDFERGLSAGAAVEFDTLIAQATATPIMSFAEGNTIQ
ncbi:MAG: hypothetical protein JO314_01900, partial [Acidobacteria bacterium]|nr:hypothetical protein [Acidobacteriota bacterium]